MGRAWVAALRVVCGTEICDLICLCIAFSG